MNGRWTALVLGGPLLLLAPAAAATDVTGNDGNDTFIVGGVSRAPGGGCTGCVQVIWVPACLNTSPSPRLTPPARPCLTVGDETCPHGERFLREWTAAAGRWVPGEARCRDVDQVPNVTQIGNLVADSARHRVPAQRISIQPRRHPLVNVPVLLHSGQPGAALVWHDVVAGVRVTTTVRATWRWRFPDGPDLVTTTPGSRWPDRAVSHVFRQPGWQRVILETTWNGTFEVAGLGKRDIAGTVTQASTARLPLDTAGAVYRSDLP